MQSINLKPEPQLKKIMCIAFLISCTLCAQQQARDFDSYMNGQTSLYGFNGNVLIARNGTIIYQRSFGYADFETKKELDGNSVFDIGSITKEFTSVGILLLKDRGKISYTDTLRKFIPELPYNNITIAQLLTHTSGIPDGFELVEKYFDHDKITTNKDLIDLLAKYHPPLLFKPGENLMYSGTGFNLLASVIEKVSGQSYNNYMDENIFKPIRMENTMVANFPRNDNNTPGLAKGYIYIDSTKSYVAADTVYPDWASYLSGINGEGMIITTTGDLLKWDLTLKNHQLLTEQTQKDMITVQAEKTSFPLVKFGYGIRVGTNENGNYVFHNGWYPGFTSMLIRYVDQDLTVIVLSNNQSHTDFIADGLASIALNKKILMPYAHKEMAINPLLINYTGKFMMPLMRPPYMVDFPSEIIEKNDSLYLHTAWSSDVKLIPESSTKFFYGDGTDQQIEYKMDRSNQVSNIFYIGYGLKKEIKRLK